MCNFRMYSLVYFIYCISLVPDVPVGRIINVIKSCKVIEVNPPCWAGGKVPTVVGALGLLDSPREVGPGKQLSS